MAADLRAHEAVSTHCVVAELAPNGSDASLKLRAYAALRPARRGAVTS
jgi:hypothetical protein